MSLLAFSCRQARFSPLLRVSPVWCRRWYSSSEPVSTPAAADIHVADDNTFDSVVESNAQPTVVDFYATWCAPCRMLSPILKKAVSEVGVRLVKVDVDESQETAAKYQIVSLPTVSFFQRGKVVEQFQGVKSLEEVLEFLQRNMEKASK